MPWEKTDQLSEQQNFIIVWQGEALTPFSELCRRFGISRKSGYKRVARFNEFGLSGIGDLSSAPRSHPNRTPAEVVEMLVRAKCSNMMLGPKKLVVMLAAAHPEIEFPAASTASNILKAKPRHSPSPHPQICVLGRAVFGRPEAKRHLVR